MLLVASLDVILYNKRIRKALIRLDGCAGWSAPFLFANPEDRFSRTEAHMTVPSKYPFKCVHVLESKVKYLSACIQSSQVLTYQNKQVSVKRPPTLLNTLQKFIQCKQSNIYSLSKYGTVKPVLMAIQRRPKKVFTSVC